MRRLHAIHHAIDRDRNPHAVRPHAAVFGRHAGQDRHVVRARDRRIRHRGDRGDTATAKLVEKWQPRLGDAEPVDRDQHDPVAQSWRVRIGNDRRGLRERRHQTELVVPAARAVAEVQRERDREHRQARSEQTTHRLGTHLHGATISFKIAR